MHFLDLPNELIESIILQLSPPERILTRSICKLFQSIVDCSVEMSLHRDLFIEGLRLIDTSGHWESRKRLLQDLRSQRDRYRKFLPTNTSTIRKSPFRVYEIWGGILSRKTQPHCFSFIELTNDPSSRPWIHDIDLKTSDLMDFTFDASSDLFVFVDIAPTSLRINLRSLINNSPHPLAVQPVLEATFATDQISCTIQVLDDRLGVMFFGHGQDGALLLYDWKTGRKLNARNMIDVTSFTFLDKNLITTHQNMASLIYMSEFGDIYLALPLHYIPAEMEIIWPSQCRSRNLPFLREQKWCQDPDIDIFVVSIGVNCDHGTQNFLIIISKRKLLEVITAHLSTLARTEELEITRDAGSIPWTDWGPDCTRWIPSLQQLEPDAAAVSGSRLALMASPNISYSSQLPMDIANRPEGSSDMKHIHILDFNPRPIFRTEESQSENPFFMQVVTEPWTYQNSGFEVDITSRLPFRVFMSSNAYPFVSVFLNGDLMIGSNREEFTVMTFESFSSASEEADQN